MDDEMNPESRNCKRCGRPLSRYNKDAYCGPCAVTDSRPADVRGGIMPPADMGARLRAVRERRGMSLGTLGGLCGVSAAYICMIETGKRPLDRYSMILSLANALRVPPSELAEGFEIAAEMPKSNDSVASSGASKFSVGGRIAELRRDRRMTQESLAERAGLSVNMESYPKLSLKK